MPRKPNPERIDQDAPEATEEWFPGDRPARDALPGLMGEAAAREMLTPRRGRLPLAAPNDISRAVTGARERHSSHE